MEQNLPLLLRAIRQVSHDNVGKQVYKQVISC
jgi:hypothetical protein